MAPVRAGRLGRGRRLGLALCGAALLAGCQTLAGGAKPDAGLEAWLQDPAVISEMAGGNVVAAAAYWGGLYERDPRNAKAAAEYAAALRKIGSLPAALEVLRRAEALNPDEPQILAEYGKALTAAGRAGEALPILDRALAADPRNWRTLTARGVALDQLGEHEAARAAYRTAIAAAPGEPAPWNNLGMSYALTGELEGAELAMREAVGTPRATARMRQNLALILGLRGEFTEAERLARADLPPAAVDGNMQALRAIVTQPALWSSEAHADNNPVVIE